jgi:mannosylglycoprotein endo-beta-mannosidase
MKIYEEDEKFWKERSSERWLLHEDNNSSYFHKIANGRRRKNIMYSLKDNNLIIFQGSDNLLSHATEFYKKLFGPGRVIK